MKKDISTDFEIAEVLNNHFCTVFALENLNNIPEFNLSYKKNIEATMTC